MKTGNDRETGNSKKTIRPQGILERMTGPGFEVDYYELPPKEPVLATEVLKRTGDDPEKAVVLTPRERVKVNFAVGIGLGGLLWIICLMVLLFRTVPTAPDLNGTDVAARLANYKTAWEIARQGYRDLFTLVITNTLLPLFAVVLAGVMGLQVTNMISGFLKSALRTAVAEQLNLNKTSPGSNT